MENRRSPSLAATPVLSPGITRAAVWVGLGAVARSREIGWRSGLTAVLGVYYNEARERSEPFLPWFSKEKKPLHNGSYEHRVPKIKKQNILLYQVRLCVWLCVCV